MTKADVRAVSIDKLDLRTAKRFLDVGAGTGSISIQAALEYPQLEVVAIERKIEAVQLIQKNRTHFECENLEVISGLAPVDLSGYFDAIFVGGTGGQMADIFSWCHGLLHPGGRLVLNFILLENALEAYQIADSMSWVDVEFVSIQSSQWTGLGSGHYFKPQNPTFILSCKKES